MPILTPKSAAILFVHPLLHLHHNCRMWHQILVAFHILVPGLAETQEISISSGHSSVPAIPYDEKIAFNISRDNTVSEVCTFPIYHQKEKQKKQLPDSGSVRGAISPSHVSRQHWLGRDVQAIGESPAPQTGSTSSHHNRTRLKKSNLPQEKSPPEENTSTKMAWKDQQGSVE
ncbi:hypothetical protein DV515_00007125 [Chloebia gouldiae]|uniref:Uncharacterized protein n=1 Tax=Chloebia gouldiae TaxID=44316 RepID=A0A3L8SJ57_CHLGU|nr:hypothetical protein DV515_00007125 [Chloebia gouldiae]